MSIPEQCPLCALALAHPESVDVCGSCYAGLQVTGAISVSATGEFQAFTGEPIARFPRSEVPGHEGPSCSFCQKSEGSVKKLMSQGACHICNECVRLCSDVMRMEIGEDY